MFQKRLRRGDGKIVVISGAASGIGRATAPNRRPPPRATSDRLKSPPVGCGVWGTARYLTVRALSDVAETQLECPIDSDVEYGAFDVECAFFSTAYMVSAK